MTLQIVAAPAAPVADPRPAATTPTPPPIAPQENTPTPPPPAVAEPPQPVPGIVKPVSVPPPSTPVGPMAPSPPVPPAVADLPPSAEVPPSPPASVPAGGDGSPASPGDDLTTITATPGVLARPNYLRNPQPMYPVQARRRQWQGTVLLAVSVSATGRAVDIQVKTSSGHAVLDDAALKAVRAWEFEPARVGRVAVESRIEVPVRFQLTP